MQRPRLRVPPAAYATGTQADRQKEQPETGAGRDRVPERREDGQIGEDAEVHQGSHRQRRASDHREGAEGA
jgi:hypothetical protein